ncbi:MAG: EI24 domain-containing protein [Myxococcales bacterium]|nr:EI24 domain-containing protein [Myxococcales bacterium]
MHPSSWPYSLVPGAVLFVLVTFGGWLAIGVVQPWAAAWAGPESGWLAELGAGVASWLLASLALAVCVLVALILAPPLSSPALEQLVAIQERELGAPPRAPIGFLAEIWHGLKAQAVAACFIAPVLLLLWLISLFVAPASVVTTPLSFFVTGLGLAWNLFDYPLTLRGVGMRARLAFVWRHKASTVGFGLAFALLFWVPCFNVLLLPVGVIAATEVVWRLLASDPLGTNWLPGVAERTDSADANPQAPAQL